MKKVLSLAVSLLLVLSMLVSATSCGDSKVTGETYDGGYYTTIIPDDLTKLAEANGALTYANLRNNTKVIITPNGKCEANYDGTPDYDMFDPDKFNAEHFASQFDSVTEVLSSEMITHKEYRLYEFVFHIERFLSSSDSLYQTMYWVASDLDSDNSYEITSIMIEETDAERPYAKAMLPVLK